MKSRGFTWFAALLIFAGLIGVGGAAVYLRQQDNAASTSSGADIVEVRRGNFDITVPTSGELAARSQVEISSQLEVRAVITELVAEGTFVQPGDVLIRLDDEEIRNRIKQAELDVENAEASLLAAESTLRVRRASAESSLALGETDVRLADLSYQAWLEGEAKSQMQTLQLNVETAQKDFDRLSARFEASSRLLEKEFISPDEYKRDEIDMIRSRSNLDQAKLSLEIYEKFDREIDAERLRSDIQKQKDRLTETRSRNENEIAAQVRDVESKRFTLERRREDLAKAQRQLEMCTITAPQAGLVVYQASLQSGWRNREDPPEIGTELRRNRTVIVLPDTSKMVAEVKVNEALSGRIRAGQRAVAYSDALPNVAIDGEVLNVGVLAESGGWRDPNRRDYSVRIALDADPDLGLKPSMRCKSSIYVGEVTDAIFVPVQAIFREGRQAYVYMPGPDGFVATPVSPGRSSELYIEIRKGLEPGDQVLIRTPSTSEIAQSIDEVLSAEADEAKPTGSGRPGGAGAPAGTRPQSGRPASAGG